MLDGIQVGGEIECMISPDTAHASGCVVRGPGARQAVSGEPAFFTILSRDRYGNTVRSGGNEFRAEVHVKGPYEKDVVPCSVTDEGNGVYEGSYTVQIGGRHELHSRSRAGARRLAVRAARALG